MKRNLDIDIGKKVRNARKRANMSIKTLADFSGLSPASIQKIETNRMSPTIVSLSKIAQALGKRVTFLIEDEQSLKRVVLTKQAMRKKFSSETSKCLHEYVAGELEEPQLEAGIFKVQPGGNAGKTLNSHPGEELILCLRGEAEIQIGRKEYLLKPGDTLNFKADIPHCWRNGGSEGFEILWVSTSASSSRTPTPIDGED
jgi:transcriptional regulator with XRE-family HTH domain